MNCNTGYKALGEESIYCNESRKWDPTVDTDCIKESGSEVVSCLDLTVSVSVSAAFGVLVCILVIIICCRKKRRRGLDYTFSRMETGIEQSLTLGKGVSVKKSTTETFENLESTVVKQDSNEYTSVGDANANTDVDNSSIEPLLQTKTMGENLPSPGRNAIEHDDQPSVACMTDSASKDKLHAIEDIDTRCDADRLGPEGQSFSTSEVNIKPVLPPKKETKDSEETFSKEFERDPSSCNKKVYEDLLQELETRSEKWLCERIVEYFEEMEEQNIYHGLDPNDQRNQAYALMRKKDIRIGHIVYHISGVQGHNKKIVLQQICKLHPNCNFCKSFY
ncbi:hypothetical protein ACJMK2_030760 [Sinanodonta woodiana]|uniref:Sushi domain-containing protein n=1 Tax=Sinanodonta woodiana TaxID=1069815 RepID=A0ABD3X057_SINWO